MNPPKRENAMAKKIAAIPIWIGLWLAWIAPVWSAGPSFDCSRAGTRVERLICTDADLSRLDRDLAEAYRGLLNTLPDGHAKSLQSGQKEWWRQRDRQCEGKTDNDALILLRGSYEKRIGELRQWDPIAEEKKNDSDKVKSGQATKPGGRSSPCWKRTKAFEDTGDSALCKEFEKVLNTTCESPDQLRCNWTIPSEYKKFKKPEWQPIEWRNYWGLIKDINASGVREDLREDMWKRDETRIRKLWEEGKRSLSMTKVDIDHDGQAELVVRYDLTPCHETPGTMFGVMIEETKRIDWRFRNLFLAPNSCEGSEILLYDGMAFMFGLEIGWRTAMIWEGFHVKETGDFGRLNVCIFEHLKGGKP